MNKTDKKYTFDLSKIFKCDKDFYDGIEKVKLLNEKIISLKGNILSNDKTLLEYYNLDSELKTLLEKVYLYANLGYDNNMSDKEWQEKREIVLKLNDDISSSLSFVFPELLKSNISYVKSILNKNNELKKYSFDMESTYRYKSHVLSEKEEKLLSSSSVLFRTPNEAFTSLNNLDIRFNNIKDEKGNSVPLTASNYSKYLESKDRKVRKSAFKNNYKFYKEHINTISSLYINKVKADSFISSTRNYDSTLESSLFDDKIDKKMYMNLINITNKNVNYLQDYYKLKAKVLGIKKLHMYDTYVNIASIPNKKIDYESGIKLVLDALKPLGDKYIKDITHLFNNRCIDVYPKKNKKSGAYQWGPYSVEPFVSLNYEDTVDSVSTTAHEMGHAMHSYYSDNNNIYCYAGYPIFLAEIASTVNEILFSDYMSNNSKDIDEKIYFLVEYLDKFKATVFRQTMFGEFEYIIHDKYEKGENLTSHLLCDTYYKLNLKHFSPALIVDDDIKYEWARIPHFYSQFYVYKYATSFMISSIIVNKLLTNEKGFKEKYIKFISSGGSNYPLELLKELGIDMSNEEVFNNAFDIFKSKVNELNKLLKEKGV